VASFAYADFDLLIEHADNSYRARVLDSPAGQAGAPLVLPLADATFTATLDQLGRAAAPSQAAQAAGRTLFDALFAGDVGQCYARSLDHGPLRIRLRLTDTPELALLPWELLYDPGPARFVALSNTTPLVRYLEMPAPPAALATRPPLNVLVMMSSPAGYPLLDLDHEWDTLAAALAPLEATGLVTLQRLPDARLSTLQAELRRGQYHIFHFTGHGGVDATTGDGLLVVDNEDDEPGSQAGPSAGTGRVVAASALGGLLHDHPSLRLAVLNACQAARSAGTDPFSGAGQGLVRAGIPAVIAMQFPIADLDAAQLSRELYAALADGYPLDAALAEARKALANESQNAAWATPVLFMRSPDGVLWQMANQAAQANHAPSSAEAQEGETASREAKRHWWEHPANTPRGDTIIADIGAGAQGNAVGKNIVQAHQTFNANAPDPAADKQQIEAALAQVRAALDAASVALGSGAGQMAGFQINLLAGELTKTHPGETPSANTITQVGGWLLDNAPALKPSLAALFALPATARVLMRSGPEAAAWARTRLEGLAS
jgi:hypothetical protein